MNRTEQWNYLVEDIQSYIDRELKKLFVMISHPSTPNQERLLAHIEDRVREQADRLTGEEQ